MLVQKFPLKGCETAQRQQCLCTLLVTRGKLHDLQKLPQEMLDEIEGLKNQNAELQHERAKEETALGRETEKMLNEIEGLKDQNAELQNERAKILRDLEKETELGREKEKLLGLKRGEYNELQKSLQEMLNEIEELKKDNVKLQNERDKIVTRMAESLQVETRVWTEIEELVKSKLTELNYYRKSQQEMVNEIEKLKIQNNELTKEMDDTVRNVEKFHSLIEGFASSTNNLEANFTEFTSAELRKVTNNYNDSLKIGEGGYGSVYKAFIGLKPVAIKKRKSESYHGDKEFNQEVISIRNFAQHSLNLDL
jgi:chromosome segregation ATPase